MGRRSKREEKFSNTIQLFLAIIIAVSFLGAYFGISSNTINAINEWIISLMVGFILSFISGSLVEAFSGDFFKKISLNIPIYKKIKFSISAFTIATFIVKIVLFGI